MTYIKYKNRYTSVKTNISSFAKYYFKTEHKFYGLKSLVILLKSLVEKEREKEAGSHLEITK